MVSEEVNSQRFIFADEMGTTTSLSMLRAWVALWTVGHSARCRATAR
jgi:hypothetical protein